MRRCPEDQRSQPVLGEGSGHVPFLLIPVTLLPQQRSPPDRQGQDNEVLDSRAQEFFPIFPKYFTFLCVLVFQCVQQNGNNCW